VVDALKRISKTKDPTFQDRCQYYTYQKASAVFAQETPDADDLLLAKALGNLDFNISFSNGLTVVTETGAKVVIIYE